MRNALSRLIFAIRIIKYECERKMNEKSSFELIIINLNIKLYLLISQMFRQPFKIT